MRNIQGQCIGGRIFFCLQKSICIGSVRTLNRINGYDSLTYEFKGMNEHKYIYNSLPHRCGPNCERDEAGQGRDGDGDAGVLHGEAEALLQRQSAARSRVHVSKGLRRHEHVVDTWVNNELLGIFWPSSPINLSDIVTTYYLPWS